MKKILLTLLLILVSVSLFSQTREDIEKRVRDLDIAISNLIEDNKALIKKYGWKTDDIAWTATYRFPTLNYHRFSINLAAGQKYVFYTKTTGPRIRTCMELKKKVFNCKYSIKEDMIYTFKSKNTGKYYYRVYPVTKKKGMHISYFTKIQRK